MEEGQAKLSIIQEILGVIKSTIFSVNLELLKEVKAGKCYVSFLMLIMFVQLNGFLFDYNVKRFNHHFNRIDYLGKMTIYLIYFFKYVNIPE